MSIFRKLISFLTGYVPDKMNTKGQPFIYTEIDRTVMLERVKLILTKGTFLMTSSTPEFTNDLFIYNSQYVEIRLSQNAEMPIRIVIIAVDGPEIDNYLDLIRIDELIAVYGQPE